jgi:hypothetical protein
VWHPRTWSDIEALKGHAEESSTLDFKKELGSSSEIAKDLAAMALNGGVLVYGVEEDKATGIAADIRPIPLKQVEERLRQIAGSGVAPPVDFDVQLMREHPGDTVGVVVVVVPASPLAPHQANHRYPFRRGTTTDYLEERDVERLYQQRAQLVAPPEPGILLERDFVRTLSPDQTVGFGYLDLLVKPAAASAAHPAGAWQRQHLADAVRDAVARQRERLPGITKIQSFDALFQWEPWQAAGWIVGGFPEQQSVYVPEVSFGATLAYPARLSFQARWSLVVADDRGQQLYRSARELGVAAEVTGMLAIAGEYFMTVPGAGILFVAFRLRGFQDAKAEAVVRNRRVVVRPGGPGAPDGVVRELQVSALQLRDQPDVTAEELIERWLPAFSAGADVLGPLRSFAVKE